MTDKPLASGKNSALGSLNWPLYFARQHCTVWQAVLLSFGLPPTATAYESLSGKRWKTFLNRRNILLQAMVERTTLAGREDTSGRLFICHPGVEFNNRPIEADDQYLDLYEFASFAKKNRLSVPPELLAVAGDSTPETAEPSKPGPSSKLRVTANDDDDNAKKSDKRSNARGDAARANALSKIIAALLPMAYPQGQHSSEFKNYWKLLYERLGDKNNDEVELKQKAVVGHLRAVISDDSKVVNFSIAYSKTHDE